MPKFVIGRVEKNEAGFEEYRFSANPYVHRSEDPAIDQARHLARKLDGEFAVFKLVATVGVEDEQEVEVDGKAKPCQPDAAAG